MDALQTLRIGGESRATRRGRSTCLPASIARRALYSNLIETVTHLEQRGIGLRPRNEHMDGRLTLHVRQFDRDVIRDSTCAGLAGAGARGQKDCNPVVTQTYAGASTTQARV
jgi:hypothetical protein